LDTLWCGRPVVTLEGNQWRNRAASYLLHRAGLDELVATTYTQYVDIAKMLILDSRHRDTMLQKVNKIDFEHLVNSDKPEDFVLSISKIIKDNQ